MTPGPFRFGAMTAPQDGRRWLEMARQAEQLGFATLLMPDGLRQLAPLPALAFAAGATTTLRVGTFVLAGPLRPARLAAWEAHSLTVLTGGRFEFGIGTGLPEAARDAVTVHGLPASSAGQRLEQVGAAIDALRELDGGSHTPVLMAASGPKALRLAAAKADIVTLAAGPLASREETGQLAAGLREAAGDRAAEIELAMNVFVVGDAVPPWMRGFLGADAAALIKADSLAMLRGGVREMADELRRRRDSLGVSYVVVNAAFLQPMAPVVELLAGT